MLVYNYLPSDLGLESFPQGELRLRGDDIEQTTDPGKADVFVLPPIIRILRIPGEKVCDWNRLPYLEGNEQRHVVYSVADDMFLDTPPGVMAFRCECTKDVLERNPDTIAWAWPVEDCGPYADRNWAWGNTAIAFHGWVSTSLCHRALTVLENAMVRGEMSCDIRRDNRFWGSGTFGESEKRYLREEFLRALATAKMSLSVRSIPSGVIRYRFYEAMSMGRYVVHVNDGCVYPFADRIDYDFVRVQVPEGEVSKLDEYVKTALEIYSMEDFQKMGAYAREMWNRYLDSSKWPEIMGEVVKEKLNVT